MSHSKELVKLTMARPYKRRLCSHEKKWAGRNYFASYVNVCPPEPNRLRMRKGSVYSYAKCSEMMAKWKSKGQTVCIISTFCVKNGGKTRIGFHLILRDRREEMPLQEKLIRSYFIFLKVLLFYI